MQPSQCNLYTHLHFLTQNQPHLILTSRRLTRLKLIQIPPAYREIALILIHTTLEIHNLRLTHFRRLIRLVHRILAIRLLCQRLVDWSLSSAAAAEEATERVADAGANCDAAARNVSG